MEHIYFEAQLCSEIAILKEKSKKAKKQKITFGGWRILVLKLAQSFAPKALSGTTTLSFVDQVQFEQASGRPLYFYTIARMKDRLGQCGRTLSVNISLAVHPVRSTCFD